MSLPWNDHHSTNRQTAVTDWIISLGLNPAMIAKEGAVLTVIGEGTIDFTFIRFHERPGEHTLCRTGCTRPGCTSSADHYPGHQVTVHLQDPPPFWRPSSRGERFDFADYLDFGGSA